MTNTPDYRPVDAWWAERRPAIATNTCSSCGQPAVEFTDALSKTEYGLSGLCQTCQDEVFNPNRCDYCDEERGDLGPLAVRADGDVYHLVCWRLALLGMSQPWQTDRPIPCTPQPWEAHPEPVPVDERPYCNGRDTRWHLALENEQGHACIGIFGNKADADLAIMLASGGPSNMDVIAAGVTPLPWKLKLEPADDHGRLVAWHLYSEANSGHTCVGTMHQMPDAIWVASGTEEIALEVAIGQEGGEQHDPR